MAETVDRRPIGHLLQFVALILFVFSLVLVASGQLFSGILALAFGLAAALGWFGIRSQPAIWLVPLGRAASLVIAMLGLGSLLGWMPELVFWNLLVPLLFFLLWPVKWATALSLAFGIGALALSELEPRALGMLRHQLVPILLLVTLLTGLFAWLQAFRTRQFAPLRRTDALTQASSQEHLFADLGTEIQRSEREGTTLTVVQLALDNTELLPEADQSALLRYLGRLLHEQLRIFDTYYRLDDAGFILILPCTDSTKAVRQAESIRVKMAQSVGAMDVKVSLSAGVTGLNVGDDTGSLIQRAGKGLAWAQSHGGNRTQPWTHAGEDKE